MHKRAPVQDGSQGRFITPGEGRSSTQFLAPCRATVPISHAVPLLLHPPSAPGAQARKRQQNDARGKRVLPAPRQIQMCPCPATPR